MANPKQEAYELLAGEYEVRVLEPSPPAVTEPPFADDPARSGEVFEGRLVVSPVPNGDLTWEEIALEKTEIADWCAERWLGAYRRLEPLPDGFAAARGALHGVAEAVVSPARKPDNEIALRYTRGGFGTPFYVEEGQDCQVRVENGELVRQRGESEERETLAGVTTEAARAIGDFYGFGCSVLEKLRSENPDLDPSLVQLWPEHFDIAFELGSEQEGRRANCGASPGDEDHPEPYIYVGPWSAEVSGELWNATGFTGAELSYAELLEADDQRKLALDFMRKRVRELGSS